jgi:xanthine/CO dehydrogenase XdhC/CoxF family maturation factor
MLVQAPHLSTMCTSGDYEAKWQVRTMRVDASENQNRIYGDAEIFIEVFAPKPKLIIIGGVHTAIPLTQFAQALGFRVTIVDGRGRFATRERFPTADEIVVAWPDEAISQMKIGSSTYVAILTHDPKFDIPALKALSTTDPRYIGSMGSRETRKQHFAELRAAGVSEEFLSRVHGPVGVDLGARQKCIGDHGRNYCSACGRAGGLKKIERSHLSEEVAI